MLQGLFLEGSAAVASAPIAMITQQTASRCVGWLEEAALEGLQIGGKVEVRTLGANPHVFTATVPGFGPRIEELPQRLQTHPLTARRGRLILVNGFPEGIPMPSERVTLRPLPDSV